MSIDVWFKGKKYTLKVGGGWYSGNEFTLLDLILFYFYGGDLCIFSLQIAKAEFGLYLDRN